MKLEVRKHAALVLAMALVTGIVIAQDENREAPTPTPGDRLRALWQPEGVELLEQRVATTLQAWSFLSAWRRLMREELGVAFPVWKADGASAMGIGLLHRYEDGAQLEIKPPGEHWTRLSDRGFDCFVKEGGDLKRVLSDDPNDSGDACVVILLKDRILLVEPEGRILLCPRRPQHPPR